MILIKAKDSDGVTLHGAAGHPAYHPTTKDVWTKFSYRGFTNDRMCGNAVIQASGALGRCVGELTLNSMGEVRTPPGRTLRTKVISCRACGMQLVRFIYLEKKYILSNIILQEMPS